MDRLLAMRAQLNERLAKEGGKVSVNDFLVKASALVGGPTLCFLLQPSPEQVERASVACNNLARLALSVAADVSLCSWPWLRAEHVSSPSAR